MGGDIHRAEGALWGFNSSFLLFCSIFPSLAENLHPLLVHLTFQLAMSGMDLCSVALRSILAHIQLRGEHWEVSNTKPVQELALHSFYLVPSRSEMGGIRGMGWEVEPLPEMLWLLWLAAGSGHVLAVQSQKRTQTHLEVLQEVLHL